MSNQYNEFSKLNLFLMIKSFVIGALITEIIMILNVFYERFTELSLSYNGSLYFNPNRALLINIIFSYFLVSLYFIFTDRKEIWIITRSKRIDIAFFLLLFIFLTDSKLTNLKGKF